MINQPTASDIINNIVTLTIKGLKPSTTYICEVMVATPIVGANGHSMSRHSDKVKITTTATSTGFTSSSGFAAECHTNGFYSNDDMFVVELLDFATSKRSDRCVADSWIVTGNGGGDLNQMIGPQTQQPQTVSFLRKLGGGINVIAVRNGVQTEDNYIQLEKGNNYQGNQPTTTLDNAVIVDKYGNTDSVILQVRNLSLRSPQQYFGTCASAANQNDFQDTYVDQPSTVDINYYVPFLVKGLKPGTTYICKAGVAVPSENGYSISRLSESVKVSTIAISGNQPATTTPTTNLSVRPKAGYEDEVRVNFTAEENPFRDNEISTLEGKAAAELFLRGVIGGFPDGEFKGDRLTNRAEAAKFLLLARGLTDIPEVSSSKFRDVTVGEWYTRFTEKAASLGIIEGHPDGSFRPGDNVQIEQFLAMMARNFQLEKGLPYSYEDLENARGDWFLEYVGIAQKYDLFPRSKDIFGAGRTLTRNEVAVAIYQFLKNRNQ